MSHPEGNAARGEVLLTVAAKEYVLRPTFQALAAIEGRTGDSVLDIIRRGARGSAKVADVYAVLAEGSRAGGKSIPPDVLGTFILAHFKAATEAAGQVLDNAFTPEESAEGKAPPAAT